MSEENFCETVDPSTLTNRQRGHLAELAFMRKAASLGFSVAKPWGEGERYDVIVGVENMCWRVQVKSVLAKCRARHDYNVKTRAGGANRKTPLYTADEIDFLVAYIFPEDTWYVFPAKTVEHRAAFYVRPGSKRSKFEQYREAWKLMRPSIMQRTAIGDAGPESAAAKAGGT